MVTYPDSVQFLYSLGNEVRTAKFALETIRAVVDELGNPERAFRVVHVAGTNGKGSTCAMIEAALRAAGHRSGLYTSPHLTEPTERIQIAGRQVTAEEFASAFNQVHLAAERMIAEERLAFHPTYFETITAMAFLLFRGAGVEIAVIETGLGGRLDATNVVQPELTVITPIDFDHERFLGNTIESIAREKAGILKTGVPAVISAQRPEAEAVLLARAAELNVRVIRSTEVNGLPFAPPLAGAHQIENTKTAIAALRELKIDPDGVRNTVWPGRLERVSESPEIVLDGAHNPAGARALAEHIRTAYAGRQVWLVYGAMRDKSLHEITEILFPLADRVILTAPANPRAVSPGALRSIAGREAEVALTVAEAVRIARAAPPDSAVFITGSLFIVGEARALLVK
jgi:dihydrofolate synthase / folylpolyglutamate synthase